MLQGSSLDAVNFSFHHDLKYAVQTQVGYAVAGICLGMCDEDMGCIEGAAGPYVKAAPPAGFLNHGHAAPALVHGPTGWA